MGENVGTEEDVELVGGPLDGLVIRYRPGDAPPIRLVTCADNSRSVDERTGRCSDGGASVIAPRPERRSAGLNGSDPPPPTMPATMVDRRRPVRDGALFHLRPTSTTGTGA